MSTFDWQIVLCSSRLMNHASRWVTIALLMACSCPSSTVTAHDGNEADEVRFQTVSRLTISFPPDGTTISTYENSLFSSFADILSEDELKRTVVEAFETWARHSAVNIGLVDDSGEFEFGTAGSSQGDPRFGDIRVGAVPMAGDVFAVAVPNDDFISGTWSGDLLFNSNAKFADATQFFAVALHEAGHALGLAHNDDDTTSVMHPTALNTEPNAQDIANLQSLYGQRINLDPFDREENNNTMESAVEIRNTGSVDGIIPLVVYGDIENATDRDYYFIKPNSGYSGSVTLRLLSHGISQLRGRITVTDEEGNFIDSVSAGAGGFGSDISLQLPNVSDDEEYFVIVEPIGELEFQFGSYSLITIFDDNLLMGTELIETAARRNYGELDQGDIQDLFLTGLSGFVVNDFNTNDSLATATTLEPRDNLALHSTYRVQASISNEVDVDFYQVQSGGDFVSVRVTALDNPGLIPDVSVFDAALRPVRGAIKVNGNGELLMDFNSSEPGENFFVQVSADRPGEPFSTGNYDLNIAFAESPRRFDWLAVGELGCSPRSRTRFHSLYVARSQLFHFGLHCGRGRTMQQATCWLSIHDEEQNLVYRVATRPGEFRTSRSVVLRPGSYSMSVHFAAAAPSSSLSASFRRRAIQYRIFGVGISEPTGPELIDPSDDPFAPCSKGSSDFCYPGNRITPEPFIVVEGPEVPAPSDQPGSEDANAWYWRLDWLS